MGRWPAQALRIGPASSLRRTNCRSLSCGSSRGNRFTCPGGPGLISLVPVTGLATGYQVCNQRRAIVPVRDNMVEIRAIDGQNSAAIAAEVPIPIKDVKPLLMGAEAGEVVKASHHSRNGAIGGRSV